MGVCPQCEGLELLGPFCNAGLVAVGGEYVPVPVGVGFPRSVVILFVVGSYQAYDLLGGIPALDYEVRD